ncbi:Lds2p RNJ42_03316 [Nakaseomyces bracarensis]|uniref:Lds2p n=1 Tax=Nakaseomyces bracarensis TaxID=273131 RepID=UPI00387161E4
MDIACPDHSLKVEFGYMEHNEIHGNEYYHINNPEYTATKPMKGLKLKPLPGDEEIEKVKQKLRLKGLIDKRRIKEEQNVFQRKLSSYWKRYLEHRENLILMRRSLTLDFLANRDIVFFPFKGFTFDYTNAVTENVDSMLVWKYYVCLVSNLFTFGMVFAPTMTMIYSFILGPFAVVLTVFQVLYVSNYLSVRDAKRDRDKTAAQILGNVLTISNMNQFMTFTETVKVFKGDHIIKYWRNVRDVEFYTDRLPDLIIHWTIELLDYIFVVGCFFIPFLGLPLVQLIFAAQNGFAYFKPYYQELKKLDEKELRKIYYQNYARWFMFGIAATVLESVPILSGHLVPYIFIGAFLWCVGDLNDEIKERTAKYGPITESTPIDT